MVKVCAKNNLRNNEIVNKQFILPDVGKDLPKLPLIAGLCGASGSGKTTLAVNFINMYKQKDAFDTIVLISPTGLKDEDTGIRAEMKWSGVATSGEEYHDFSKEVLNNIIADQKERLKKYKLYRDDKDLWLKFNSGKKITSHELIYLYDKYDFREPMSPFGKERFPTLLIVLDDCTNDCRSDVLGDFASKSRHCNASVMVLVQHYFQMGRPLRKQLNLIGIFKTADKKVLTNVYEEMASGDMDFNEFQEMFKLVEERKDFIMIDLKQCDDEKRYRLNLDKYLSYSK